MRKSSHRHRTNHITPSLPQRTKTSRQLRRHQEGNARRKNRPQLKHKLPIFLLTKQSPEQKALFLQTELDDLQACGSVKPPPAPKKDKKMVKTKITEEEATHVITGYQPTGAMVNDIII